MTFQGYIWFVLPHTLHTTFIDDKINSLLDFTNFSWRIYIFEQQGLLWYIVSKWGFCFQILKMQVVEHYNMINIWVVFWKYVVLYMFLKLISNCFLFLNLNSILLDFFFFLFYYLNPLYFILLLNIFLWNQLKKHF